MSINNPIAESPAKRGWLREHIMEIIGVLVAMVVGFIVYARAKNSGSSIVSPGSSGAQAPGLPGSTGGGFSPPFTDPSASAPNGGLPSAVLGIIDNTGQFDKPGGGKYAP